MAVADLTPAEELRAAATRLRAAPTGPARLDDTIRIGDTPIGTCHDCGVIPEFDAPLDELLVGLLNAREPLAAWLEDAARTAGDHRQVPGYGGLPDHRWCADCQDEECAGLRATDKALAVARVINGVAEQPGGEPAPAEQPVTAADLRPDMVVSHPAWNDGHRVRIVTAHDDGSQMVIHYRDVRVRRPDAVVVVPLDFQVTPGAGFEDGTR